jgi:hypothetical protein
MEQTEADPRVMDPLLEDLTEVGAHTSAEPGETFPLRVATTTSQVSLASDQQQCLISFLPFIRVMPNLYQITVPPELQKGQSIQRENSVDHRCSLWLTGTTAKSMLPKLPCYCISVIPVWIKMTKSQATTLKTLQTLIFCLSSLGIGMDIIQGMPAEPPSFLVQTPLHPLSMSTMEKQQDIQEKSRRTQGVFC